MCIGCNDQNLASNFCAECNENLCSDCVTAHKKVKFTRNHNLMQIKGFSKLLCTNCDDQNVATHSCPVCKDKLCDECVSAHKKVKVTRNHNLSLIVNNND